MFLISNANSADSDQTPRSAASDLGLHCLPMSLYETIVTNGLNVLLLICIIRAAIYNDVYDALVVTSILGLGFPNMKRFSEVNATLS